MSNTLYYLNRNTSTTCPQIPIRYDNYLNKSNYLSEFESDSEKKEARSNLGITNLIEELNNKIDSKVISRGGVAWDLLPTEGNTDRVLSSDALYKAFAKYVLKGDIEDDFQELWTTVLLRLEQFEEKTDRLEPYLIEIVGNYAKSLINELVERVTVLEKHEKTYYETGIPLDSSFGDNDYLGISLKTLTDAINRIWEKLAQLTGEEYNGITLRVNPEYFIGENGCTVHVTATTESTNGMFEKLQLYIDGELVTEVENTSYFEYDINITETSVLMCKAKILGSEYTKMKTIVHYNSFWLGAGQTYEEVMDLGHNIPITNGMKNNYNVSFKDGDHLFVIVGKSLRESFYRADMNGMEIPFTETEIILNGDDEYRVFTSNNTYKEGTYNIDINS